MGRPLLVKRVDLPSVSERYHPRRFCPARGYFPCPERAAGSPRAFFKGYPNRAISDAIFLISRKGLAFSRVERW